LREAQSDSRPGPESAKDGLTVPIEGEESTAARRAAKESENQRYPGVRYERRVGAHRAIERPRSRLEGRRFVALRLLSDACAAVAAVAISLTAPWREAPLPRGSAALLALPALTVFLLYLRGQYSPQLRRVLLDDLIDVASSVSIAAMTLIAATLVIEVSDHPSVAIAPAWALTLALASCGRAGLSALQTRQRMTRRSRRPALIVGAGLIGAHIARRLKERPEYGLEPIGFLDADPLPTLRADGEVPLVL
jgi:FlaA1/EpsC-like NDP-sugar epimerase